jgi:hypothetical protein
MRTAVLPRSRAGVLVVVGLLTALLAVLSVGPGVAAAAPVPGACPSPLTGQGTAGSPCLIGTAAELYAAMAQINADTTKSGASTDDYELTANIDATSYSAGTAGPASPHGPTENWAGINWFTGTFNGDRYTISNLNYTTSSFVATLPGGGGTAGLSMGFFRVLDGATVENLTLRNVRASNTAASNFLIGGVAVWGFASTITGVALLDPTIADAPGGGNSHVGGLVTIAHANAFADDGTTVSDGGSTTLTNNAVSGATMASVNRTGGIVSQAQGPTTIADNYVDIAFTNSMHPPNTNTSYAMGGLVGQVAATYKLAGGANAAPVAMSDNVISGSIAYSTTGPRSSGGQNYVSATVGLATTAAGGITTSNWTSTNNLVSSALTYTNATGPGIAGADGISVSPATLRTEATYSGTDTGQTDATTSATYDDLAWNFGSDQSSDASGWAWDGDPADGSPAPAAAPTITLANPSVSFVEGPAPTSEAVLTAAGATTNHGTLSVDTTAVDFATPGSYTATVTATNGGFTSAEPLTIIIVSDTVALTRSTGGLVVSSTPPTTAAVLAALGAVLPQGDGGTLGVEYPNGEPDWGTLGSYTVRVTDTGGVDGLQPATGTIVVVARPTVSVAHETIAFDHGATVTAQDVLDAADPAATYSSGDSGTVTADVANLAGAVGLYTAEITATDQYGIASAPVTVTVGVTDSTILLGDATPVFQVTGTAPSAQDILSALGPVLPAGSTGTATVTGYTPGDFQTPGQYPVTVSDTDTGEGVTSATATIEVVAVSVVSVTDPTVYFNTSAPPTVGQVISAAGARVTDGGGLPVPGATLSTSLPDGCATTVGSCTVTLTGRDPYGFTTAPVQVTVDVSAAAVAVAHSSATFVATASAPSQDALVSALGATVTGATDGGQPEVDTSGVHWSVPGTYAVTVGDGDAHDAAGTVAATIRIVPMPVVSVPVTTVYLPESADNPLPAATLIANAGAALTDGQGNAVAGTLAADASGVNGSVAGTYSATITGTDDDGFTSAPVTVTVVIYLSAQQAGGVTIAGTPAVGSTLTATIDGWAPLATPTFQWLLNGVAIPGATAATYTVAPGDAGGNLQVVVTEAPDWYAVASATSAHVTVPAAAAPTPPPAGPTPPPGGGLNLLPVVNGPAPVAAAKAPTVSSSAYAAGAVKVKLHVAGKGTVTVKITMKSGGKTITLGTHKVSVTKSGTVSTAVKLSASARAKIRRAPVTTTVTVTFTPSAKGAKSVSSHKTLKIKKNAK